TPFETTIVLDTPIAELPPYLIINDQVWQITLPEDEDISADTLPEFEEYTLVAVVIDDVTATLIDGDEPVYELALSGSHGVGCEVPIVYSVRELAESTLIGV